MGKHRRVAQIDFIGNHNVRGRVGLTGVKASLEGCLFGDFYPKKPHSAAFYPHLSCRQAI